MEVTVPKGLMDVSNGRLISKTENQNGSVTTVWRVLNPINNYGVNITLILIGNGFMGSDAVLAWGKNWRLASIAVWQLPLSVSHSMGLFVPHPAKKILNCR